MISLEVIAEADFHAVELLEVTTWIDAEISTLKETMKGLVKPTLPSKDSPFKEERKVATAVSKRSLKRHLASTSAICLSVWTRISSKRPLSSLAEFYTPLSVWMSEATLEVLESSNLRLKMLLSKPLPRWTRPVLMAEKFQ